VDDDHPRAAGGEGPANQAPTAEAAGAPAAERPAVAPRPGRRVEVVYDVNDASEMANILASQVQAARRPRPMLGVAGAALGAAMAAAGWFFLMRTLRNEALIAGLGVALMAGIGAVVLGGRCRANQVAAVVAALAAVVSLRLVWANLAAAAELERALQLAGPHTDFARVIAHRIGQRLSAGALARGLFDGLGFATYLVVTAVAWRIPRRP
jgi:hypothetical protein